MDVNGFLCSFYARFVNVLIYQVDWFYAPFTIISGTDFRHYEISVTITETTTTTTTTGGTGAQLTGEQIGYGYTGEGYSESQTECDNDEVLCGCQAVPKNQIDSIEKVISL